MRKIVWAIMLVGLWGVWGWALTAPAHAAVFWDCEMEAADGCFYYAPWFTQAEPVYSYDTVTKMSGNGSIRVNFPLRCDITREEFPDKQCGGSVSKSYPRRARIFNRYYFRMSGRQTPTSPCITPTCLFVTSQLSSTKVQKYQSNVTPNPTPPHQETEIRGWFNLGSGNGNPGSGGKQWIQGPEHNPGWFGNQTYPSGFFFEDNRWYCVETELQVNTPSGTANGVIRTWVDGVQIANVTNVTYQRPPGNHLWDHFSLMRQNGAGFFWFDRFAAGDTKIGCVVSDTTPPSIPGSFTVQ